MPVSVPAESDPVPNVLIKHLGSVRIFGNTLSRRGRGRHLKTIIRAGEHLSQPPAVQPVPRWLMAGSIDLQQ